MDPVDVVARMARTYSEARSYRDSGTTHFYKNEEVSQVIDFTTEFVRPNLIRYIWKSRVSQLIENRGSVVSDGTTIKYDLPTGSKKVAFSWNGLRDCMLEIAGHTENSSRILNLLLPDRFQGRPNLGIIQEVHFDDDLDSTKSNTFALIITPKITPIPCKVKVDKENSVITAIELTHRMRSSGFQKVVDKQFGWKKLFTPGYGEQKTSTPTPALIKKTSTTYDLHDINPEISLDRFR